MTPREFINNDRNITESKPAFRIGKSTWINLSKEDSLREKIYKIIEDYHKHNPLKSGINVFQIIESFKLTNINNTSFVDFILRDERISSNKNILSLITFKPILNVKEVEYYEKTIRILEIVTGISKTNLLRELKSNEEDYNNTQKVLESENKIININGYIFLTEKINLIKASLSELYKNNPDGITVASFKEITGLSQIMSVAILDYFDSIRNC